jgi:hypothetical protein
MKKSNNEHMHVNTAMEKRSSKKSGWKEEGGRTGRLVCAATELQARSAPPQVFVLAVAEAMHPNEGRGGSADHFKEGGEERKGTLAVCRITILERNDLHFGFRVFGEVTRVLCCKGTLVAVSCGAAVQRCGGAINPITNFIFGFFSAAPALPTENL